MIAAGLLAYVMGQLGFSPVAMLIGFILGPMLERFVGQILSGPRGSLLVLFERPLSLALVIMTALMLVGIYRTLKRSRNIMETAGDIDESA
jgi:putative tricarboxylic transport membrane protein